MITDTLQARTDLFSKIYEKLFTYFNDYDKTIIWLTTYNPLLGNMPPINMIFAGRGQKLLDFINTQIEEGKGP